MDNENSDNADVSVQDMESVLESLSRVNALNIFYRARNVG